MVLAVMFHESIFHYTKSIKIVSSKSSERIELLNFMLLLFRKSRLSIFFLTYKLKFQDNALQGSGSDHFPSVSIFGDLHGGRGGQGGLSEHEADPQLVEEVLVLLLGGPLVLSLEVDHGDLVDVSEVGYRLKTPALKSRYI